MRAVKIRGQERSRAGVSECANYKVMNRQTKMQRYPIVKQQEKQTVGIADRYRRTKVDDRLR